MKLYQSSKKSANLTMDTNILTSFNELKDEFKKYTDYVSLAFKEMYKRNIELYKQVKSLEKALEKCSMLIQENVSLKFEIDNVKKDNSTIKTELISVKKRNEKLEKFALDIKNCTVGL